MYKNAMQQQVQLVIVPSVLYFCLQLHLVELFENKKIQF